MRLHWQQPEESVFFHELAHAAHEKVKGTLKAGQDPLQEVVAELSAQALCRMVGNMDEHELQDFIDRQKPSSWGNVDQTVVNGRTVREMSPCKRVNYENELNRIIDAARARERRLNKDKKHKP